MSNNDLVETGFSLQPKDMSEAMSIAAMIANSQLAPKNFQGKTEDTLVAMMMGHELGLNPMQAIQNIAVINGKPSIWGDALLALVQNHPKFKSIEETFDESKMMAICVVTRKGGKPHTATFSQEDATQAGLWGVNTWKKYPKRMLAMRARGFALRNQFADALCGLITREEAIDMPDEKEINPVQEEIAVLPDYPQENFKENLSKWVDAINAGTQSADNIINKIECKYVMSDEQKTELRDFKKIEE